MRPWDIKQSVIFCGCYLFMMKIVQNTIKLEMWANAQRDGRPAEYRWRPLFNAAVWLTPDAMQ